MSEMIADSETVHIYLQSYELSKPYLKRALDSIKNQTYTNWICHIFDNGSSFQVKSVIKKIAELDERFKPLYFREQKQLFRFAIPWLIRESGVTGYYMKVDADDELEPIALARMVESAKANNLDMTVAGASFIDGNSGKLLGVRGLSRNVVVEGREFGAIFEATYQLMRTHWIKLYKMEVIQKVNLTEAYSIGFGGDTIFVRETILGSNRIGVMTDILYKYYQINYENRGYNKDVSRIYAPGILLNRDICFLAKKCGTVTEDNLDKLLTIYIAELKDIVPWIIKGNYGDDLIGIMHSVICTDMFKVAVTKVKSSIYVEIARWLVSQTFWCREGDLCKAADIFSAISLVPNMVPGCPEMAQLLLYIKIYSRWNNREQIDTVKQIIKQKVDSNSVLRGCPTEFICDCEGLIEIMATSDYKTAQEWVTQHISDEYGLLAAIWRYQLVEVGLKFSALNEDIDTFKQLKRMQIDILAEDNWEEAIKEREEWDDLLNDF